MCTPSSETIKEKGQEMASEYVNFINKCIDDDDDGGGGDNKSGNGNFIFFCLSTESPTFSTLH